MENAEEIYHFLEEFSKRKQKPIPQELNDYLAYVARTGDPVYQWSLVKSLFKEKLITVITDFYETSPVTEIPPYPNVDPFNYDTMKNSLIERLDSFTAAPFTVQRICELLTYPRKQYNRIDKFMRAIEKNILVVSTREPGAQRHIEPENGEPVEPIVNGSDNNSDYNVDVEMEDMSWKENSEQQQNAEPQPSSSDAHIAVDDIESHLKVKREAPMEIQEKATAGYESLTPAELNATTDEIKVEPKSNDVAPEVITPSNEEIKTEATITSVSNVELKTETEIKTDAKAKANPILSIPDIKVDDPEMTERKLIEQAKTDAIHTNKTVASHGKEPKTEKESIQIQQASIDDSSSDSSTKTESEHKLIISEVSTSSEESSSSNENTDGSSNSPKTDTEPHIDVHEESNQSDTNSDDIITEKQESSQESPKLNIIESAPQVTIQSDNYSISDMNSELPQVSPEISDKIEEPHSKEKVSPDAEKSKESIVENTEKKVDNVDS